MSRIEKLIYALKMSPHAEGLTRYDLAEFLCVSKPTVAVLVAEARKSGFQIKTGKFRQGRRGPKAFAYRIAEGA